MCTEYHKVTDYGLCALCHGIQNSMAAILACHTAWSTEWLDWVATLCELWGNGAQANTSYFTHYCHQALDRAGWQAKMASIDIWIPWRNVLRPNRTRPVFLLRCRPRLQWPRKNAGTSVEKTASGIGNRSYRDWTFSIGRVITALIGDSHQRQIYVLPPVCYGNLIVVVVVVVASIYFTRMAQIANRS